MDYRSHIRTSGQTQRVRHEYGQYSWHSRDEAFGPYDSGFVFDSARRREDRPIIHDLQDAPTQFTRFASSPPVIVISGEGGGGLQFNIPRSILFDLLPRTESPIRRQGILNLDTFFPPNVMEENPTSMLHRAFFFIFRQLEEFSYTGQMDMFASAELHIETSRNHHRAANEWGSLMNAVCVVLDNERGLGCSSFLLGFIMPVIDRTFRLLEKTQTKVLFRALSCVFSPSRQGLAQLRGIWDMFDSDLQEELLQEMRLVSRTEGSEKSVRRMYRALRRQR